MHYLHNYDERKKFLKMSKEFWNPPVERFIIYIYITRGEGQRHGLEEAALRDLQVTLTVESTVLRRFQMVFIFPRVLRMKLRLFEFYISVLNLLSFINIHLEDRRSGNILQILFIISQNRFEYRSEEFIRL